ncbi:MAG: mandelate racemase/muconate lactonizing enzyme family protein [Halanaeroarchaeum sp.]
MNASLTPFELPLTSPFETSSGTIDARKGWVLELDGAVSGVGEATPLPGFTESHGVCETALIDAVAALRERDWPAAFGAVSGAPAARHALVTALLDWRSRGNGRPLYRELGGRSPVESIGVQAAIGDGDRDATVAAAGSAVDSGFETLKLKVGARPLEADVDRIVAVREAVGPAIEIRIDVNGAWDRETAQRAVESLDEDAVALIEQPLEPSDLAGHRKLRGDNRIALDESLVRYDPERILSAEAADVLVLKPMALGGVDVARGIAYRARRRGFDVVVSNTVDGAIARTAAVHLAASLPQPTVAGLATASLLEADVATDPSPVEQGRMAVPQDTGLGIDEVTVDA